MMDFSILSLWTMAVGVVASVSCSLVGCYLVLRRMSLLGDAISHAVLPGIAVAFLLSGALGGWPMLLGAMAVGVLTTMLTELLHKKGRLAEDSSMGAVFTSLFAIGVILLTRAAQNTHIDADCILYGLIETVALDTIDVAGLPVPRVMVLLAPMLLVTILFVSVLWKELKIVSFDPSLASAMGLSAPLVHYLLMAMTAGVTVASFQAVGSILVVGMLIVPPATALLLTDRLGTMLLLSAVFSVLSVLIGYWGAVAWNTSLAGSIAVASGLLLALAVLFSPTHGLVSQAFHAMALSVRIVSEDLLAGLYRKEEFARGGEARASGKGIAEAQVTVVGVSGLSRWIAKRLLLARSWIRGEPDGSLQLTDGGRHEAQQLIRAHRLWESYLGENFDLPVDHLHEAAHRMEHYIGPQLQEELAAELVDTTHDPHGREIPRRN